jgi:hypothetical protein
MMQAASSEAACFYNAHGMDVKKVPGRAGDFEFAVCETPSVEISRR